MAKNSLIIAVITVAVLVIGVVAIYITQRQEGKKVGEQGWIATVPDDINISGWKTYRSEKYGFEMKHPSTWTIKEQRITKEQLPTGEEEYDYIGFYTPTPEHSFLFPGKINLSITIHPLDGRTLASYVNESAQSCKTPFGECEIAPRNRLKRKELKVTINGLKCFDVICLDAEFCGEQRYIYFEHNDQVISLHFYSSVPEDLADIIINSFSFTN